MTFKLEIELENDAMQDAYDVAEALRNLATYLRINGLGGRINRPPSALDGAKILDANGNTVGKWELI